MISIHTTKEDEVYTVNSMLAKRPPYHPMPAIGSPTIPCQQQDPLPLHASHMIPYYPKLATGSLYYFTSGTGYPYLYMLVTGSSYHYMLPTIPC